MSEIVAQLTDFRQRVLKADKLRLEGDAAAADELMPTRDELIEAIQNAPGYVQRTCISMITNGKCRKDTLSMSKRLCRETDLPLSILCSPTILSMEDFAAMRDAGVDKLGVALDLATQDQGDLAADTGLVQGLAVALLDLAADMGWEYQLVDWEWYGPPFDPDKPFGSAGNPAGPACTASLRDP